MTFSSFQRHVGPGKLNGRSGLTTAHNGTLQYMHLYRESQRGDITAHTVDELHYPWLESELRDYVHPDPDPFRHGKRWEDAYIIFERASTVLVPDGDAQSGSVPVGRYIVVGPDGTCCERPRRQRHSSNL